MGRTLALVALLGLAAPAAACINDKELPQHEREFRSQYKGPGRKAAPARRGSDYERSDMAARSRPIDARLLYGGGAALLLGAFALVSTRARVRG